MADPGIGTRPCQCDAPRCERDGCQDKATNGGSIDLLTALDLLGKAEARVAELEAERDEALASMERYFDKRDEMYLMDAYRTLTALAAVRQEKAMSERVPEFVYAESREQAQEVLDESYLTKYEAHPVGTGARVAELEAELEKLVAVERAARTQDIHGLFAALAAVRQEKP